MALGHPAWGVLAGLGALYAGFASFRGAFVDRFRIMWALGFAMAIVAFLGGLLSRSGWWMVAGVTLASIPLALYSLRSRAANTLAVQATGTLIVLAGIPQTPAEAAANALIVLSGVAVQTLVLMVVWPFNPHRPEQRAVANVFHSLAGYVERLRAGDETLLPEAEPFSEAREILAFQLHRNPSDEDRFLDQALRTADAIRAALVAYSRTDHRMRELGGAAALHAEAVAADLQQTLLTVARAIESGHHDAEGEHGVGFFATTQNEPIAIHPPGHGGDVWREHREWRELLRQELLEIYRPVDWVAEADPATHPSIPLWRRVLRLLVRVPRELPLEGLALQHAFRYALVVGVATAMARMIGLQHAYWLPLTAALILRPDYASTLHRGVGRLAGTLVGVAFASAVVDLIHPGHWVGIALMLAGAWLAAAAFLANYAIFAFAITVYVVLSISTAGAAHATALQRLEATFLGVFLAIGAYFVWPIWQSRQVWNVLRQAAQAQVEYGGLLLRVLDGELDAIPDDTRYHTRGLRLQAETLVNAAEVEPRWSRGLELSEACDALEQVEEQAAILLSLQAEALQDLHREDGAVETKAKVASVIASATDLVERIDSRRIDAPVAAA